ncbi:integrase/recombinase XerD [Clostridium moniliforme]|uniref:Integrase/recombinase XerD n=1 Tax=Clostridium moniliforme TaxID=39489 RepID=A0ABS4F0J9_9CLOT|nr:tyrosine-type recombinase/integrase [Clostridium moniliforme]MBP1889771.1 integrase/recombinase XerD [Clostridium moniliforme]
MPRIKSNKTLESYIHDFIDYCNLKDLAVKTKKSYYQSLMLFSRYLQEEKRIIYIKDINKKVVEEYLEFTKERGKYSYVKDSNSLKLNHQGNRKDFGKEISAATLNNYLRNIKVFFNWCEENNVIKNNTISKVKFIKNKRKAKEQLDDVEIMRLLKSFDLTKFHEYRDYTIVNLILDTGMRITECLNLTINDIDLQRRTILIPAEINKGKKDRVVFYSQSVSRIFQSWLRFKDSFQETELLFPTQRTNSTLTAPNFERNFRLYKKRANIKKNITPHGLRNNFARRFLLSGGDIYTLSRLLGHSSVTVTEAAYLDLLDNDLRKRYSRFSPIENLKGGNK